MILVHGRFNGTVEVKDGKLFCEKILITAEKIQDLKWNEVDVDVVAECTGFSPLETAIIAH
jgi:glyceraldehyde 3-phosphate dehydrogenase